VTVSYSNGQTRVSGDEQLDGDGNAISGVLIEAYLTDCNTVGFSHQAISTGTCTQYATKQQKLNCNVCCAGGVGCDCSFGTVVTENYTFMPDDPSAECDQSPELNYVTGVTFSLTNCGGCGCCPLLSAATTGQSVSLTSDCSCKSGSLSGSAALDVSQYTVNGQPSAAGSAVLQTSCEYEIDNVTYFASAYITVICCECDDGSGQCIRAAVDAYTAGADGNGYGWMSGYSSCGKDIVVGQGGILTGTVNIDAYNCNATLTFG
jgi:hypothetical protein